MNTSTPELDVEQLAATHLSNWREVVPAFLAGRRLPPLRLLNGFAIHHGERDTIADLFYEIFVEQAYTRDNFYDPLPGDCVLDLGANIGVFAIFICSQNAGVRVHCFEPAPENVLRLRENAGINGLAQSVRIRPFAVLDSDRQTRLHSAAWNGQRSLFVDRGGGDGDLVRSVSLRTALDMAGTGTVDLLKIDVEGAEIEILEGAGNVDWGKIRRVALEYHDFMRPGCRERALAALDKYGFRLTVDRQSAFDGGIIRGHR